MKNTPIEEWRPIPGFDGVYQASSLGRIISLRYGKTRIMKQTKRGDGYFKVNLFCNKRPVTRAVHVLCMLAFYGPPGEGQIVCHNNGNRADNRISNIRYDTYKGNAKDAEFHGTRLFGEKHPRAKLTKEQMLEVAVRSRAGENQYLLALEFGITQGHVSQIKRYGRCKRVTKQEEA